MGNLEPDGTRSAVRERLLPFLVIVVSLSGVLAGYILYVEHLDSLAFHPIEEVSTEEARSAGGLAFFLGLPIGFLILMLLGMPFWLWLLYMCWAQVTALLSILGIITLLIVPVVVLTITRNTRLETLRRGVSRVPGNAEPIIEALENFRRSNDRYPDSLGELVPTFISEIPQTGLAGYPDFQYDTANQDSLFREFELWVDTSKPMNWDKFVYWPESGYPDFLYGGWTEKFGDWVYVHE